MFSTQELHILFEIGTLWDMHINRVAFVSLSVPLKQSTRFLSNSELSRRIFDKTISVAIEDLGFYLCYHMTMEFFYVNGGDYLLRRLKDRISFWSL